MSKNDVASMGTAPPSNIPIYNDFGNEKNGVAKTNANRADKHRQNPVQLLKSWVIKVTAPKSSRTKPITFDIAEQHLKKALFACVVEKQDVFRDEMQKMAIVLDGVVNRWANRLGEGPDESKGAYAQRFTESFEKNLNSALEEWSGAELRALARGLKIFQQVKFDGPNAVLVNKLADLICKKVGPASVGNAQGVSTTQPEASPIPLTSIKVEKQESSTPRANANAGRSLVDALEVSQHPDSDDAPQPPQVSTPLDRVSEFKTTVQGLVDVDPQGGAIAVDNAQTDEPVPRKDPMQGHPRPGRLTAQGSMPSANVANKPKVMLKSMPKIVPPVFASQEGVTVDEPAQRVREVPNNLKNAVAREQARRQLADARSALTQAIEKGTGVTSLEQAKQRHAQLTLVFSASSDVEDIDSLLGLSVALMADVNRISSEIQGQPEMLDAAMSLAQALTQAFSTRQED